MTILTNIEFAEETWLTIAYSTTFLSSFTCFFLDLLKPLGQVFVTISKDLLLRVIEILMSVNFLVR